MKPVEKKAVRLVTAGAVNVDYYQIDHDHTVYADGHHLDQDRIVYAQGTVDGDHGRYTVTIQPDGDTCDCMFGLNRPGQQHAHTIALRLAVWNDSRKVST